MYICELFFLGRPDAPYDLQFVNSTHNSVTITWNPGFDGGSTQWFQVRYNEIVVDGDTVHRGAYKYEDVEPKDATVFMVSTKLKGNFKRFHFVPHSCVHIVLTPIVLLSSCSGNWAAAASLSFLNLVNCEMKEVHT